MFNFDTLVMFMPEQRLNEETGEFVNDSAAIGIKGAMACLSDYQLTMDIIHLYRAIIEVCNGFELDLVESVESALRIQLSDGDYSEQSVLMLFHTIEKDAKPFDIDAFIANLLTTAHYRIMQARNEDLQKSKEKIVNTTSEDK